MAAEWKECSVEATEESEDKDTALEVRSASAVGTEFAYEVC